MPTYLFECDQDNGCGHRWEIQCPMSELDQQKPKSCPQCNKHNTVFQVFGDIQVNIPKTLGSLADKNTRNMSADERAHLTKKFNEYKETPPSWTPTKDGMVHTPKNVYR